MFGQQRQSLSGLALGQFGQIAPHTDGPRYGSERAALSCSRHFICSLYAEAGRQVELSLPGHSSSDWPQIGLLWKQLGVTRLEGTATFSPTSRIIPGF